MTQTQLNLAGHLEGHQVRLTCPSLPRGQSNFPIFWIISWNYLLSSACLLFLCLCRIGWFGCTCKLYLCKCLSSSVFGRNYWEHKNNAVIRYSALIHLHRFWILADIFTAYADEFLSYAYKFFLFLLVLRLNLAPVWSILCTFASMSKKKKIKKNYCHNPCLFLSNLVRRETRKSPNGRCEKINWNWKELGVNSTKGLTFSPPCTPNQILRFVNKCVKFSMDTTDWGKRLLLRSLSLSFSFWGGK